MRRQRRGESALETIGGIVVVLAIIGGAVWFFNKDKRGSGKDKGDGGSIPSLPVFVPERPDPVVAGTRVDRGVVSDSDYYVTVRNVGGAGKIRVTVTAYRQNTDKRLNSWSTLLYLQKGEEKEVKITLKGLGFWDIEGGVSTRTSATAE